MRQLDFLTVNVRELRAHLTLYLNRDKPAVVGNRWKKRAVLVPIPDFQTYDAGARRSARAEARRRCLAAIEAAFSKEA